MNNSCKDNFKDSNELLKSVEDIAPIYLDPHGEGSHCHMVELTANEPIVESGLLFLDPHGDPDVHRCIVELAKKYGRDPNLLKID